MKLLTITLSLVFTLSFSQLALAKEKILSIDNLENIRKLQVINEVKKQMKINNSEIALEVNSQNYLNLPIQGPEVIETSNYMSGSKNNSFEERSYLASIKILSLSHCMGECNIITTSSILVDCKLEAKKLAAKNAIITCKLNE